jgi:hypothetical protein
VRQTWQFAFLLMKEILMHIRKSSHTDKVDNQKKLKETFSPSGHAYKSRPKLLIIIGVAILVILGIIAVPFYQKYIAPFNRTIISIDNVKISMRYFLERARISGSDPMSLMQTITEEELIKIMAPQYGIQVTDADVETQLRSLAAGDAGSISDVEFREWYRQQLISNNVTDSQYKEIMHTQLLSIRLQEYLAERVPTISEQVHLYWIVVNTLEDAYKVEERLNSGESFANLAKEVSIDVTTKDRGGELGWYPPKVFNYEEQIAELNVNQYTSPIAHYAEASNTSSSNTTPTVEAFFIFMVADKDPAREVDESNLAILKSRSFSDWYNSELNNHDVKYNFNSEILDWLIYQLEKNKPPGTVTTTNGS